jgi:hypothetical protein
MNARPWRRRQLPDGSLFPSGERVLEHLDFHGLTAKEVSELAQVQPWLCRLPRDRCRRFDGDLDKSPSRRLDSQRLR